MVARLGDRTRDSSGRTINPLLADPGGLRFEARVAPSIDIQKIGQTWGYKIGNGDTLSSQQLQRMIPTGYHRLKSAQGICGFNSTYDGVEVIISKFLPSGF